MKPLAKSENKSDERKLTVIGSLPVKQIWK